MGPNLPSTSAERRVDLMFEGRVVPAREGDTVASALLRDGVRIFSRGPKYHRPRGAFCLAGSCAQCHMRIGDEPNVPACITSVSDGLVVERQNVLGSADTDLLRAIDYVYPTRLDHHHLMTRPRPANEIARNIARRLAGLGPPPSRSLSPIPGSLHATGLLIVGAGRTGRAIAVAAALAGLRPLVVDSREGSGEVSGSDSGRDSADGPGSDSGDGNGRDVALNVEDRAEDLGERWIALSNSGDLTFWSSSVVVWLGEEGGARRALVRREGALVLVDCEHVVLATGDEEFPDVFEGNDLPGHHAGRGLLRFVQRHGFAPGSHAVIVRTQKGDEAEDLFHALTSLGLSVPVLLDATGDRGSQSVPTREVSTREVDAGPSTRGVALLWTAGNLLRAVGGKALKSVEIDVDGKLERIDCDLLAVCGRIAPRWALAGEAGATVIFRDEPPSFLPSVDSQGRTTVFWLSVAGRASGQVLDDESRRLLASRIVDAIRGGEVQSGDTGSGVAVSNGSDSSRKGDDTSEPDSREPHPESEANTS